MRRVISVVLGLLLLAALGWLWFGGRSAAPLAAKPVAPAAAPSALAGASGPSAPIAPLLTNSPASAPVGRSVASTNREFYRLSNTAKKLDELLAAPRAILLENAFVDTAAPLALNIPAHMKATAEPGAYLVQARGPVTAAFRAALASAGAQIVSYIPNNAYLVQLSGAGAGLLAGHPQVQAVLPYEPYYKVQASLLGKAVEQAALEPGKILTLGLFANGAQSTVDEIKKLGGHIIAQDRSPFGPVVRVQPPADWLALARLPGVMRVEPATRRQLANDLTRVTMNLTTGPYTTNENWLGLYGSNIVVQVNDTGIDAAHPDFSTARVTGLSAVSLVDTEGHGTHVAGIIAGNGSQSTQLNSPPARGSVTNADFRGKAPLARLYALNIFGADTNVVINDSTLQEIPALTNALISNNSWGYGVNEYDLSAASFDAAVRDALPETTGPQPVLFVFAAGNDGGGQNNGSGGNADTIDSPATAKNVVTVGALEQYRNITNEVVLLDGTTNAIWLGRTDSSTEVAAYSARGNVGVQTEGTYGRFKPDVVAPGTFVVSCASTTWDKAAYYSPTNVHDEYSPGRVVLPPGELVFGGAPVPNNAVGIVIRVLPNQDSPIPFPTNFPIYFSQSGIPGPTNVNDFATSNNILAIPPLGSITPYLNSGFNCAVGNPTNQTVSFDFEIQVLTTNDAGNTLMVLSNLNETVGPWYFYDSGTSMAAPATSGALALMQEFFTSGRNPALPTNPSPALLKAVLINGARLTSGYDFFAITNSINYEGWGLVNVPNSLPRALTNTAPGVSNTVPMFILDQSPTNVLATGDTRTYNVTVPTSQARNQFLRLTLAWTDPPGNPASSVKLVNNLDLVVTNLDSGKVYFGNTFSYGATPFSLAVNSNSVSDNINNVENIWLPAPLGTNYSVTVVGRNVAVNAVTLEQTNVVQDFALIISSGDANNTNGITVATAPVAAPFTAPQTTYISSYTNGIYFGQLAGASAPWLSTNNVAFGSAAAYATNSALFIGQTNQWHFFVVTNTTPFTNAAFIIFIPNTQATPREGVFETSTDNSTRPEADLNLFVASAPDANAGQITNLNYDVISNCVFNVNGDQSSLARGGTKFIVYSNSTLSQVYYVGVQCQDQLAANFGFLSVFSQNPFSQLNDDGSQTVNGLLVPVAIPDGNNARAGVGYCVALAIYPMEVGGITVTNTIQHENFGDLLGILSHSGQFAVLNNHDGLPNPPASYSFIYNDNGLPGTVGTSGPGSLRNFTGKEAAGPWIQTQVDDSQTQTGSITGFTMNIQPHVDLTDGLVQVFVPAGSWWYGYVDVPVGFTNMLVVATNITAPPLGPVQLYLNTNTEPTFTSYLVRADLTNGIPPGNSISYGPPLEPERYFVGLFNPSAFTQTILIGVRLAFNASAINREQFGSTGGVPLKDDAVTYDSIFVTATNLIREFSVGLRVDHPRISDLVFTLINPAGQRYLLMENRGGQSTNGAGATIITTNLVNVNANGGAAAQTNYIDVGITSGTFPITYNFYTAPDQMTVYYGTNPATFSLASPYLLADTGLTNNAPLGPGPQNTQPVTFSVTFPSNGVPATSTYLTIIMNQFGNAFTNTQWTYTAGGVITNNYYLTFTEDTNYTTTPIKYAVPPFALINVSNVSITTNITLSTNSITTNLSTFESIAAGSVLAGSSVDGWTVDTNQVSVVSDPANAQGGSQFLALASGSISRLLPTPVGSSNVLTYTYRGPGIAGWWRGEGNAADAISGNNGTTPNGIAYSTGMVDTNFSVNGVSTYVSVASSPLLNSFTNRITIELWAKSALLVNNPDWKAMVAKGNDSWRLMDTTFAKTTYIAMSGLSPSADIIGTKVVNDGGWHHVAASYDGTTMYLYVDGVLDSSVSTGGLINQNNEPMCIGANSRSQPGAVLGYFFNGLIDEVSLYRRPLSASEISAICQRGATGKFDPAEFAVSPAQSLAQMALTLPGSVTNAVYGSNNVWQTNSIAFIATSNATPFTLTGLQPGMLLDSVTLTTFSAVTNYTTNVVLTASNLYYLPEDDISGIIGQNPYGEWFLEILDNRAGATNNANLVSWSLNITTANTNFTTGINTNTFPGPVTNFIPGGGLQWYLVQCPTNADWATNSLLFATLPLKLWWSTNVPPSVTNATDSLLLNNSTGGSAVIGTNPPVPYFNPGGFYYLGVQNTNVSGATYGLDVTFHLFDQLGAPLVITLPATNANFSGATLNGSVNPSGLPATAWFEYGLTTNYTDVVGYISLTNTLFLWQGISLDVTNLSPGTVYHFRAVATNSLGTNYGADLTFVTALPAYAYTAPVTLANGSSAQLNGFASPNGSPSIAWFEFGTTPNYGVRTPPVNVGSGSGVVFVTNDFTGLTTNLPYHYRLAVSNIVGVAYGFDQIFDQANVVAWGANYFGQVTVPTSLTNLVYGIGAGYDTSLAVNNDGTVVVWGDNSFNQTNVPPGLNNAVAVSGTDRASVALRSDRTVLAWGSGLFGVTNPPANLTNAVGISAGSAHVLALRDNGLVTGWGFNATTPAGLSNIVSVAAGELHSLALKDDGTVAAWGYNGDGATDVPAGLNNVVAISAGYHSLALKADGSLVAWGYSANGQTNVPAGTNFIAIAAGSFHSLALKRDGTVVGWGDNGSGQYPPPSALSNAVAIAAGGLHSLALSSQFGLNQTNYPPFWTNGLNGTTLAMNEMTNLVVNNRALDTNKPNQILFYQLATNSPAWAAIDPLTGFITFTPGEADGPSTNLITTVVRDNGFPPLSATNSFTLVVNEVNRAPYWPTNIPGATNFTINAMSLLTVVNTASDDDLPVNGLGYELFTTPTNGTGSVSAAGVINWRPVSAGVFTLTTVVTDTNPWAVNATSLRATNSFTVTVLPPLELTNGVPLTNTISSNSVLYYLVNVPTNADFATNSILFSVPSGVNLWFSTNNPPTITATNDTLLLANTNFGSALISPATAPKLVPGSFYWLAVQNTNAVPVDYGLQVDFHLVTGPVPPVISSIIYTNGGFLLTWFAPSNYLFQVQWSDSLAPVNWQTFTNPSPVSYNTNVFTSPTNTQFNFFDDGSQAPFIGMRFYRLLLITNAPNTAPVFLLGPAATRFVTPSYPLIVTNTAADAEAPPQTLTYSLVSPPVGVTMTNGVIYWTPSSALAGTTNNTITTIVTDSGSPALSATNVITVWVNPLASISSVTFGTNGTTLQWTGWTNEQFQVQWTTNLAPPNWQLFPGIITSTNGTFTFVDTNTTLWMKFYQLILLP